MRILLDECIDERLRHQFGNHDCQTARFANFAGLKNGKLLLAAEESGFEVFITVDRGIPYQQNIGLRRIAIFIVHPIQRLLPSQSHRIFQKKSPHEPNLRYTKPTRRTAMHITNRPFTTQLPTHGPDVEAITISSAVVAVEAKRT
jgi:hypothetical protein